MKNKEINKKEFDELVKKQKELLKQRETIEFEIYELDFKIGTGAPKDFDWDDYFSEKEQMQIDYINAKLWYADE